MRKGINTGVVYDNHARYVKDFSEFLNCVMLCTCVFEGIVSFLFFIIYSKIIFSIMLFLTFMFLGFFSCLRMLAAVTSLVAVISWSS